MLRTLSLTLAAADTDIRTATVSGMPPVTAAVCLIDPELHGHVVILKDIRDRNLFQTSLHAVAALGAGDRRHGGKLLHHPGDRCALPLIKWSELPHISRVVDELLLVRHAAQHQHHIFQ